MKEEASSWEVNVRIGVMQNPHVQNVVLVSRCSEEQTGWVSF